MILNIPEVNETKFRSKAKHFGTLVKYLDTTIQEYPYRNKKILLRICRYELDDSTISEKNVEYLGYVESLEGVQTSHSYTAFDLSKIKFSTLTCDHCHVARKRNKYFMFMEKGNVISIGSSCVDKYFEGQILHILKACTVLKQYTVSEETVESFIKKYSYVPLSNIVGATREATNNFLQWEKGISSKKVIDNLEDFDDFSYDKKGFSKKLDNLEINNEFNNNIFNVLSSDFVAGKNIGIAAYGIYKIFSMAEKPNYTIGEKLELENVSITSFYEEDFGYGPTYKVFLTDSVNNFITNTSTGSKFGQLVTQGPKEAFSIKGTVKYLGDNATVLTRVSKNKKK